MYTRIRLKLIRMTSLVENHPSFAKSIGVRATIREQNQNERLKNE